MRSEEEVLAACEMLCKVSSIIASQPDEPEVQKGKITVMTAAAVLAWVIGEDEEMARPVAELLSDFRPMIALIDAANRAAKASSN